MQSIYLLVLLGVMGDVFEDMHGMVHSVWLHTRLVCCSHCEHVAHAHVYRQTVWVWWGLTKVTHAHSTRYLQHFVYRCHAELTAYHAGNKHDQLASSLAMVDSLYSFSSCRVGNCAWPGDY